MYKVYTLDGSDGTKEKGNQMAKYRGIDLDKKVTVRFNLGDEFGFTNGCEGDVDDLEFIFLRDLRNGDVEWVSYIMVDLGNMIVPCARYKSEAKLWNKNGAVPGYDGEVKSLTGMKVGWVEAQK